jgi:tRNA dimethylallyltransferase
MEYGIKQVMKKLLIICGPTATGKTKLGIKLAKKFNGEIVSADSRQVYKGMDIGTGKDITNFQFSIFNFQSISKFLNFQTGYYEIEGIKVWLLDVVKPDYKFNVADYKKCADVVIEDILKRGKLPIIVGGTGFYIKAITEEIETMGIKPDWKLRNKLANFSINELQIFLKKMVPKKWEAMNESDKNNPRRLVRAIEIARISNFQFPISNKFSNQNFQNSKKNMLFIGLTAPFPVLYQRIDKRVEERVKDGIENEISELLKKGYGWNNSALGTTLAYSEWKDFFEKKSTKEEVVQRWKYDEHNYARRQMTWFRKMNLNFFDITKNYWQSRLEKKVANWYSKKE